VQIRSILAPGKSKKCVDECSVGSPSELRSQSWWTIVCAWCGRSITSWYNLITHRRFASQENSWYKCCVWKNNVRTKFDSWYSVNSLRSYISTIPIFRAGKARWKAVFQPCDRCHKKK